MTSLPKQRLAGLDDLRGLAALSVCLFHVTGSDEPGRIKTLASFGFLGVYVFFVISGFILPYTMRLQGYHMGDFARFMAKRLARLYPPYLASLGMILVLSAVSSQLAGYHGGKFSLEWPRLLSHLTYTTGILGFDWYNLVYWTLGIEFQYYLLIGLAFPALAGGTASTRLLAWGLLAGASFIGRGGAWVAPYLPLFLLGIWAFWHETNGWNAGLSWGLFAATLALCWGLQGTAATVAAGGTALAIVLVKTSWRPLQFLGMISYSLYLIHLPLFHYLARLRDRGFPAIHERLFQSLALAAAVLAAWIMYRVVEVPSMRLATRIRYSRRPAAPVPS